VAVAKISELKSSEVKQMPLRQQRNQGHQMSDGHQIWLHLGM